MPSSIFGVLKSVSVKRMRPSRAPMRRPGSARNGNREIPSTIVGRLAGCELLESRPHVFERDRPVMVTGLARQRGAAKGAHREEHLVLMRAHDARAMAPERIPDFAARAGCCATSSRIVKPSASPWSERATTMALSSTPFLPQQFEDVANCRSTSYSAADRRGEIFGYRSELCLSRPAVRPVRERQVDRDEGSGPRSSIRGRAGRRNRRG